MVMWRFFAMVLAVVAMIPAFFSAGPWLERGLSPVLDYTIVETSVADGSYRFSMTGEKNRSCKLDNYGVAWGFDHSYLPAALADSAGNPRVFPAFLPVGRRFMLGPYYVPAPEPVKLRPDVRLILTLYYRCHLLWLTEQDIEIPVSFAP
jgi:hypothetical protein